MNSIKAAALLAMAVCLSGICFTGYCEAATIAASVPNPKAILAGVSGDVRGLAFSPDGKRVAVSTGQVIKIWEWESGKEVASIQGGIGAAFSSDGALIAYPGQDESYSDGLMIWDIAANKKKLFIAGDNVQAPAFSPDGKSIAAAIGSRVNMWKLPAGEELPALKDGHKCSISAIVFSKDGKTLISADGKGVMSRWELSETGGVKKGEFKYANEEAQINSLTESDDGKWVAASTGDGMIVILDAPTMAQSGSIKAHKDGLRVKSISFSPDNKTIASACSGVEDLEIKFWDVTTRQQIVAFIGHENGVNSVAYSPDGKWLASGSDDKTAKVWEVSALMAMNTPKSEKKKEKPKE